MVRKIKKLRENEEDIKMIENEEEKVVIEENDDEMEAVREACARIHEQAKEIKEDEELDVVFGNIKESLDNIVESLDKLVPSENTNRGENRGKSKH